MAEPDVDGALVGGASLQAGEFASICRYHSHRTGATAGAAPAASGS
nr:triose-phosphate isomerase [Angustibacter aerolatus]